MADIIMLANEFDKQGARWRRGRTLDDLAHTHIGQPKHDGCHLIMGTGHTFAWATSRTGEEVHSVGHIARALSTLAGPGYVFQGEVWAPNTDFPQISGAFRRHSPQPQLRYVVYDWHTQEEFDAGVDPTPYRSRLRGLQALFEGYTGPHLQLVQSLEPGSYPGSPAALARYYVGRGGYDGFILRDPNAGWAVGRSKQGELVKVKPTLSLDLRVEARISSPGIKTGRDVFTLVVMYRGVTTTVGSGVPHDAANVPTPGQIIEVECMGLTAAGKLREPRFKAIRYDKKEPDA